MGSSIYRSAHGRVTLLAMYDALRAGLGTAVDDLWVETRFGRTHILRAGDASLPPLLIFQGGNSLNPHDLRELTPLTRWFCLYAPDTLGHPGYSAEVRLSTRNLDYGRWAADVVAAIGRGPLRCLGASFGGGILAHLAAVAPEQIARAVFIVPAGFVDPAPGNILTRLAWPMLLYRLQPTPANLARAVSPLSAGNPVRAETMAMIEAIFSHVRVAAGMPRAVTATELRRFQAPSWVIAGEQDLMFPGEPVLRRARQTIDSLVQADCLVGAPHMFYTSSTVDTRQLVRRIGEFLALS